MNRYLMTALTIWLVLPICAQQSEQQQIKQAAKEAAPVQEKHNEAETSQPSLDETTKWLTEKLPSLAGWVESNMSCELDSVLFQGCTLHYRLIQKDLIGYIRRVAIPLGDIDPLAVRISARSVTSFNHPPTTSAHYVCLLQTKTDHPKTIKVQIALTTRGIHGLPDAMESETEIPFRDEPTAERFAKAFARAATLCAKQKEPF